MTKTSNSDSPPTPVGREGTSFGTHGRWILLGKSAKSLSRARAGCQLKEMMHLVYVAEIPFTTSSGRAAVFTPQACTWPELGKMNQGLCLGRKPTVSQSQSKRREFWRETGSISQVLKNPRQCPRLSTNLTGGSKLIPVCILRTRIRPASTWLP